MTPPDDAQAVLASCKRHACKERFYGQTGPNGTTRGGRVDLFLRALAVQRADREPVPEGSQGLPEEPTRRNGAAGRGALARLDAPAPGQTARRNASLRPC